MCGRYSLICTDDLGNRFRVPLADPPCRSRFNVAPTQVMPVVVHNDHNELVPMEWGLIPHWAAEPAQYRRPINARAETLPDRPMFRGLLRHHRCLVPASGFYEWKRDGLRKTPYYLRLRDAPLFAFAGLYDRWTDRRRHAPDLHDHHDNGERPRPAIHDRMPASRTGGGGRWLDPAPLMGEELARLLGPYPSAEMEAYPVSLG